MLSEECVLRYRCCERVYVGIGCSESGERKKESSDLHLSFRQRVVEFSFGPYFPEKLIDSDSFLGVRYLTRQVKLTDTNLRNSISMLSLLFAR